MGDYIMDSTRFTITLNTVQDTEIAISSTPDPRIVEEQKKKENIVEGLESLLELWS